MSAAAWKGKVDFGIITIREDEYTAVLKRFPEKIEAVSARRVYRLRRLMLNSTDTYTVAILRCIEQGNGEAHEAARDLLEDLAPRWLLVVGIAGGVPAYEFTLGDVIVSTRIVDFSVEAVLKDHSRELALGGGPLHRDAATLAADIGAMVHDGELGNWNDVATIGTPRPSVEITDDQFYGDDAWRKDVREKIEHHFQHKPLRPPLVTTGAIASSDRLIKEAEILAVWLKIARQVQAVEMESSGVYRATQGRVPFLAIRGISDVVGFKRRHDWTEYACHTAAAFLVAFLRTRPIPPQGDEPQGDERRREEAVAPHGTASEVKAGSVSLMSNVSAGSGKDGPGGHVLIEAGSGWGGANGAPLFVGPGLYRAGDGGAGPGGNLTLKGGDAFASLPSARASASGLAARSTDLRRVEIVEQIDSSISDTIGGFVDAFGILTGHDLAELESRRRKLLAIAIERLETARKTFVSSQLYLSANACEEIESCLRELRLILINNPEQALLKLNEVAGQYRTRVLPELRSLLAAPQGS